MNAASALHISIFGMRPVVKYGNRAQKEKYLPSVASGEMHVAFGVTEPDAGTDTTSISTRAVRDGDDYIVHGQKVWRPRDTLPRRCCSWCARPRSRRSGSAPTA
jgi:acyl-CoA dehydrogenase